MATDFFLLDPELTDDERAVRDRVRAFGDTEVLPVINDYWQREAFPHELVPKLAALEVAGGSVSGYGCPGMTPLAAGLVTAELARADGSVSTFHVVHSGLAMATIAVLGSDEQRHRWLPGMARLEALGAFALTEPAHGSDVVALETRARRDGDDYVIDGDKRWIGNGSVADLVIVWARDDDGSVGGFVVETPTDGFDASVITGKTANRALWQADITLRDVRVPAANRLDGARSFADTSRLLAVSRQSVAWEALGHAIGAYEAALAYTLERHQFGRPVAAFQMVQERLARMLSEITAMQTLCRRMAQLQEREAVTLGMASLAKFHTASAARRVCADARDVLGGNGILLDHHVARHHADMEAVYTYEGTDFIQALIVGREVTGLQAFSR